MKLKQWKEAYPTYDLYYTGFHQSLEGIEVWKIAYESLNEEISFDVVMDGLEEWLLNDVDEKDYENAEKWFESMQDDLAESVYAGLT